MDEIQAKREQARAAVRVWLNAELYNYADPKWDAAPGMTREDPFHTEWTPEIANDWVQFVLNYLTRVNTLEGPPQQQAALKAMVTCFEMCVTMVIGLDGEIPAPGQASGDVEITKVHLG